MCVTTWRKAWRRWMEKNSPAGCCLPTPLRLFPCGVLVQLLCWSLSLGIWLLHATARLPCSNASGVVVCFLASFCFMAAKAFGPVSGLCYPLHHGAFVVVVLCAPALRYSSSDDPGPHWTPLSYTLAILCCMCDMLCSYPFLPSPPNKEERDIGREQRSPWGRRDSPGLSHLSKQSSFLAKCFNIKQLSRHTREHTLRELSSRLLSPKWR